MDNTKRITLEITGEKEQEIQQFLQEKGWLHCVLDTSRQRETVCMPTQRRSGACANEQYLPPSPGNTSGHTGDILNNPNQEECPFCFLRPCVTFFRQQWLGDGQRPNRANGPLRTDKYKKFWAVLSHRGAWTEPRYTAKKRHALDLENRTGQEDDNLVWTHRRSHHVREIMPDCVLKLVRGLYPNPASVP